MIKLSTYRADAELLLKHIIKLKKMGLQKLNNY